MMGLAALPFGAEEGLTEVALRSPHLANGVVVTSHEGGDFATKNPRYLEVEFNRPDGRREFVRVGRVEHPLAAQGERIDIEYAEAKWIGLVAQQAGYEASFARAWIVLLASGAFAATGIGLVVWSLLAAPPAPRPPLQHGPSMAERPDWTHRTQ